MASLKKIEAGQVLWSVKKHKMGNTSISTQSLYPVKVIEVNLDEGFAIVSWNGNAPVKYRENQIRALKVNKPEKKYVGPFGNVRY